MTLTLRPTQGIDLTGEWFGKLQVVRRDGSSPLREAMWLCRCGCGLEKSIPARTLKGLKSCGCLRASPWPERDDELRERWAAGESSRTIGTAMEISPSAVLGRVHRLHLPSRPSPIKPRDPSAPRKATAPRVARAAPRPTRRIAAPEPHHVEPAMDLDALHRAVTRTGCEWPQWGDRARPTHIYCGAPVQIVDGSKDSYCIACASRARTALVATGFRMNGWGK